MLQTHRVDQGEDLLVGDTVKDSDKIAEKGSDSTDEMANVLGTLGAENILASGGLRSVFTIASIGVSPVVAAASGSFPTAAIFTTASVATPTTRVTRSIRGVVIGSSSLISFNIPSTCKKGKGKGKMTEPKQPIKEKVHVERELNMMIAKLDRSNEMVAKYLSEYEQAEAGLSHDEKVELIFFRTASTEPTQEQQFEEPKELSEEELNKMIELVPVEELYIEALQGTSDLYASGETLSIDKKTYNFDAV
uniref:Uncharacterized protein n=1 Tax=Tanacetum cinerariifolium TaxID=118510 RepID=A0A699JJW1_TANCI|nr:hypothetical protein [Tanacetum cinerariifolium]